MNRQWLWRRLGSDRSAPRAPPPRSTPPASKNDHVMLVRAFPRLGVNPGLGRRRCLHLTPREIEKLELHQVGLLAQKRLARGLKLNQPEATALIATVCLEKIRDGHSVAQLMTLGQRLLGRRQVLPGVAELVSEVQVEGTFRDGTKLLTVHDPIASDDGDLHLALRSAVESRGGLVQDENRGVLKEGARLRAKRLIFDMYIIEQGPFPCPGHGLGAR